MSALQGIAIALALSLTAALAARVSAEESTAPAEGILSAFYGLDDSRRLRVRTLLACRGIAGGDGMPVIFSEEIDDETLDPEDFRITTQSGAIGRVGCVTLRPADEAGEKRTVLVIGDYGSASDRPVTVDVVGDLMSLYGDVNFKGSRADVIPLDAGPTMMLAETAPLENWSLGGRGDCPREGVAVIVRVTWTGGVTKPGGDEIDAHEMRLYRVSVRRADGSLATVTPVAVGDLNDNDNNHELCLDVVGRPERVSFPAGALTDPNEDLNPASEIAISNTRPE